MNTPLYCGIFKMHMIVLITINLRTKFEMSRFIRSKDMRHRSRDTNHAYLGTVSHQQANTLPNQLAYTI